MKIYQGVLALTLLIASGTTWAQSCSDKIGCAEKTCQIETQLEMAKLHDNQDKEAGLTTALQQAKLHCTDASLESNLYDDISDVQKDMAEHKADLVEAMQDNKADKIKKYQDKIAEDEQKLDQLQLEAAKFKK
ncbi:MULTISPECIES: DUF1090 domain-containing protein [Vibrio]|uniref:DUF1090 family protein n=1 Tax=Vibrio algicola TaxID=2662262 RepID=A0A5Q0TI58_9VIBR|nr:MULTISPECIES: DUF1090 domain-containing protein [Vibrio]MBD1577724.1 DUF1090 family protein [Vibrio sp. S11_S32]